MKYTTPLLSLLFLPIILHAQTASSEEKVRIDIASSNKDPIDFDVVDVTEGGKAMRADWNKEAVVYSVELPAEKEWKQASITITPFKTGTLNIMLLGPYVQEDLDSHKVKPVVVEFDDVSADATTVQNGGFERVDSDGRPFGWYSGDAPTSNPPITDDNRAKVVEGEAAEGIRFVRVWHNSRVGQTISVQENIPVILSFSYRLAN
jgi:hypothetical protein